MAGDVVVQLSGDERQLVDAYRRAVAQAEKLPPVLDKTGKEAEKADRDLQKLANHVKELQASPVDKLAQAQEKLTAAVSKGMLTQQEANKHMATLRAGMVKTDTAAGSLAANVVQGAVQMVAGYMSVSAAVGAIQQGMEEYEATMQRALESQQKLIVGNQQLRQVAPTNEEYQGLQKRADELAMSAPMPVEETRPFLFAAKSFGVLDKAMERKLAYADLFVSDAQGLLRAGGAFKQNTAGSAEESNTMQGINMILEGSQASEASFDLLDPQAKAALQGFAPAGLKGSEAVGAAASVYSLFGESTGPRLRAFGQMTGQNEKFKGKDLLQRIDMLDADAELMKDTFGGNMEATQAYNELSKQKRLGVLQSNVARVQRARELTGTDQDALSVRIAASLNDPNDKAQAELLISKNIEDITNRNKHSKNKTEIDTGTNNLNATLTANSVPMVARWMARAQYFFSRNDDNEVEAAGNVARAWTGPKMMNLENFKRAKPWWAGGESETVSAQSFDDLIKPSLDAMKEMAGAATGAAGALNDAVDRMKQMNQMPSAAPMQRAWMNQHKHE